MKTITITNALREMIAARTPTGQLSDKLATRLPDGRWEVQIDDDVHATLLAIDPDPETAIRQAMFGGRA